MSSNVIVSPDGFGASMDKILRDVNGVVREGADAAVKRGLATASRLWRRNAREELSTSYLKSGYRYTTGQYARSISYKMATTNGDLPHGEAGSRSMPGLPHLLELGHATLGGGRVNGKMHIATAAEEAFELTEEYMEEEIGKRLVSG